MSLLSAILLGFYDVAKKEALKRNGVLEVLAAATAITALLLCPFLSSGPLGDHLKLVVKAVIVSASWVTGLEAVKLIPLTTASTIKATRPMIVVVLSILLFGEVLNAWQWTGVFLVLSSLFLLGRSSKSEGIDFRNNKGVFQMVLSVLTGAGSALYDKYILKSMEPMFVQSWSNIYITVVLVLVIAFKWKNSPEKRQTLRWDWYLVLIAVLITVADALYFFAIKQSDSMLSIISLIRRSSVIITFAAGAVLYKEHNIRSKAAILTVLMIGMSMLMLGSARAQDSKIKVVCWGDSLTADSEYCYPRRLQELLGSGYEVINCGIGGENTLTIMARQGAAPMYLAHDIQVFRSKDVRYRRFIGGSDIPAFLSLYDGKKVTPLLQGEWKEGSTAHVNPVIIDGKEFTISSEAHHWYEKGWKFEYNYFIDAQDETESTYTLPAGSLVTTQAMETLRRPEVNIIFVGQNGGYADAEELLNQIRLMKEYGGARRTLVISFHAPNEILKTAADFEKMESLMQAEFGADYINLRRYMMDSGLRDAGLNAADEDLEAIAAGRVPPQLLTDGTHFTPAAYGLIAAKVLSLISR